MRKANTLSTPEMRSGRRRAQTRPSGIIKISLLPFSTLLKTHSGRRSYTREERSVYTHQPARVTSNNTGQPVIFPRGPFHLIGHAQLIPCVDPEHEALLISRLAESVCVCVCVLRVQDGQRATESMVAAAAWRHRGSAARSNEGRGGVLQNESWELERRAALQRESRK